MFNCISIDILVYMKLKRWGCTHEICTYSGRELSPPVLSAASLYMMINSLKQPIGCNVKS